LKGIGVVAGFVCFFVGEKFFDVVLVKGFDVAGVVGGEAIEAFGIYYDSARCVDGLFVAFVVPGDGLTVVAPKLLAW
jgi:hypothetical protein